MPGRWRMRKRVRLGRLIVFNLTGRGVSISIGWRGLTLNVSTRGIYVTISARGTGVSYRVGAPWKRWLGCNVSSRQKRDEDILEQGDEPWIR